MIRGRKVILLVSIILLQIIIITGCWDNRDLTNMGIIAAVGLDKTVNNGVEITVQLIRPEILKAKSQGSPENAYWTYSASGETVFAAVRNLLRTAARKVYFRDMLLLIIDEDLARDGLMDVLDFFERDQEPNRQANILIAKGITAREVLEAKSELEDVPAMHLNDIVKNNVALAKIKKIMLIDLLKQISHGGHSPVIGVIQIASRIEESEEKGKEENKNNLSGSGNNGKYKIRDFEIEGGAVLKKDKLVGWLDCFETRGVLFALNNVKSGIINVPNPLDKSKDIAFEIVRSSGKTDVEFMGGKPVLAIEIKAEGRVGEQQGIGDITRHEVNFELEKEVGDNIKKDIEAAVNLSQKKYRSDIFGFGEVLHRKNYNYWERVMNDWDQVFSQLPVKIKVSWKTRNTQLIKERTTVQ